MTSWRDRLCGSIVLKSASSEEPTSIYQLLNNQMLICGGGFYPVNLNNQANMSTFKNNFILPTNKYSVLVFKQDGNAVIYSEEDDVIAANGDVEGLSESEN